MIRTLSTTAIASLLFTLSRAALAQAAAAPEPPPPAPPAPAPAPLPPTPAPAAPPPPAGSYAPPPPAYAPAPPAYAPAPPAYAPAPPAYAPPPAYPPAAAAPAGSQTFPVQLMTLRIMRDKGILSQAEYDSAVHDLAESVGTQIGSQQNVVVGKFATTLYGFVESDAIWDSTRSLNDLPGNSLIARPGTAAGDNGRVTFGARNSRIGFRIKTPEIAHSVRASAMLESDFLGAQPTIQYGPYPAAVSPSPYESEGTYFTSPTFRIRHMNLKIETPVVDILFGQYWQLYGWQSAYQPNTVEIQGVPGEIYSRTPQLRISKTVKAYPVTFEIAVAAVRPVQRDSETPDGEGGLRLALDSWTGTQTVGSTGTQISPLSVAVTGLVRHVAVNGFSASATNGATGDNTVDLTMGAVAADAFIPVIPGTKDKMGNSLSFNGEFSTGYGDADMYTGLTGGIGFPSPTTGTYTPDIDPGIVTFDYAGKLHGIQWTSYLVGAQYYFPGLDGKMWVSGNYSHMQSANMHYYAIGGTLGANKAVMGSEDWFDVSLFVDPIPAIRFGLEYANTKTTYVDGIQAINHRVQLSGFFIF